MDFNEKLNPQHQPSSHFTTYASQLREMFRGRVNNCTEVYLPFNQKPPLERESYKLLSRRARYQNEKSAREQRSRKRNDQWLKKLEQHQHTKQ